MNLKKINLKPKQVINIKLGLHLSGIIYAENTKKVRGRLKCFFQKTLNTDPSWHLNQKTEGGIPLFLWYHHLLIRIIFNLPNGQHNEQAHLNPYFCIWFRTSLSSVIKPLLYLRSYQPNNFQLYPSVLVSFYLNKKWCIELIDKWMHIESLLYHNWFFSLFKKEKIFKFIFCDETLIAKHQVEKLVPIPMISRFVQIGHFLTKLAPMNRYFPTLTMIVIHYK